MAYQYLPGQHLVRIWKPLIIFGGTEQLMRLILMTGKGGVGKTSVAAATGLRCAELGYKTLVFSPPYNC